MALPTTGITTTIVSQAIGLASNNVGQLCTHSNINKWSKWKPVAYNTVSPITTEILSSVRFGLSIPVITGPSFIVAETTTGVQAWGYNKPTGGAGSPFRLGDFRGYNHSATNNINIQMTNNKGGENLLVVGSSDIGNYTTTYSVRIIEDSNSDIKFSDLNINSVNIGNLNDLYLSVAIGSKAGTVMDSSYYKVYQAPNNISVDKSLVIDTSRLRHDGYILDSTDVVIAAVLMPKLEVGQQFVDCVSLRLNTNTKSIVSAPYSILFDGAGGGTRPVSYISYVASWSSGMYPLVNKIGTNFEVNFDMLNVQILSGSTSIQYRVEVYIDEINKTYTIGYGVGSTIVDTAVSPLSIPESLIIPNNIHNLTIRTYLVSQQVGYSFTTNSMLVNTSDYINY